MVHDLKSLNVFVASPSDVADERTCLEEVIRELNITWSQHFGIQLNLVRWETHAFPGFGDDAQDVVNTQISDDYDIFIGIMWCRYGTETNRSGSGTIEEFDRAKAHFDSDPNSVQLMLYFKDAPIAPSQLNPSQLVKVTAFKASIGKEGALYWTFSTLEQFEKLIRLHLSRQVQAWLAHNKDINNPTPAKSTSTTDRVKHDELASVDSNDEGILDLMEIFESRSEEMNEITIRISNATKELGIKITARTKEINDLVAKSKGTISKQSMKRLIAKVATDMDNYVARMETEIPLFGCAVSKSMNAFIKAMNMSLNDGMESLSHEETYKAIKAAEDLQIAILSSENSLVEFRVVVLQLPRLTSSLNIAKRKVVQILEKLIIEFKTAHNLANEAETTIKKRL